MTTGKSLRSLQAGRGIAALAVVAFHLSITLSYPRYLGDAVFQSLTWRGSLGVDFFFVLSGFIILFAHHRDLNRREKLPSYLLKRFIRLFPIYWIYVGVFCLLLAFGAGTAAALPETTTDWITTIFLIRFDNFNLPINPAWTLIHEIAFYVVFATLIFNRRLGIFCLVLWTAVILANFTYPAPDERAPLNTYFSAYNLDFLLGMGAYLIWRRNDPFLGNVALIVGILLFAITFSLEANGFTATWLPLVYGTAFAGILAGVATRESHGSRASNALLDLLGNASYSIYLTHNALLGLFAKIMIKIGTIIPLHPYVIFLSVFVLAVAGGCVAYLLIEKPVLAILRRLFFSRPDHKAVTQGMETSGGMAGKL